MKQYSQNVATGKEVIEHFIKELKNEGITYVPPWQPPESLENEKTDDKYVDNFSFKKRKPFFSCNLNLSYRVKMTNGGSNAFISECTTYDLTTKMDEATLSNNSSKLRKQGSISPTSLSGNFLYSHTYYSFIYFLKSFCNMQLYL